MSAALGKSLFCRFYMRRPQPQLADIYRVGTTVVQRVTHFFQQQFDSHDANLDRYLDDLSVPGVMLELEWCWWW